MNELKLQDIDEELANLNCDIRAEVVAGQISENRTFDDLSFVRKGSFSRQFRKDINTVYKEYGEKDEKERLIIEVNREGFYDFLPEDLFHFSPYSDARKSTDTIIDHLRKQKNQEQDARLFFAPVEDELSHLLLNLERVENETVQAVSSDHGLLHFFEDPSEFAQLHPFQRAKFLFFLPLAHKFRGNVHFLNFILKTLLNKRCKVGAIRKRETHGSFAQSLGSMVLGVDSILGGQSDEKFNALRFSVFDVTPDEVISYMGSGNAKKIIDKITEFFVPLNLSIEIDLNFTKETKFATTSTKEQVTLLGFNSVI